MSKRGAYIRLLLISMLTACCVVVCAQSAFAGIYDDAVGYWNFDDGSGTTATDSGTGGSNGSLVNFTGDPWVAGKVGGALAFDGSNDYVDTIDNDMVNGWTALSISAWLKPTQDRNTFQGIVMSREQGSVYHINGFYETSSGVWNFYLQDASTVTAANSPSERSAAYAGQWVHLVGTWEAPGSPAIYINGVDVTVGSGSNLTVLAQTHPFYIGWDDVNLNPARRFLGSIDEVAIWNTALDVNQVDALYKAGFIADAIGGLAGLDYTTEEVNQLANLYYEGEYSAGPATPVVTTDGVTWIYTPDDYLSSIGDYDVNVNGHDYYIRLGSGLYGDAVPELPPFAGQMMVLLFGGGFGFFKRRKK